MSPLAGSPSPRMKRVLWIVLIVGLFVVQLVDEGRSLTAHPSLTATPFIWFASYALIALLFLGIGSLVWLYGYSRQRTVATLLFTFCSLMTFAFGTLSSSAQDSVLNAIGSVSSALAVLVLLFVLVLFPVNLLNSRRVHPKATALPFRVMPRMPTSSVSRTALGADVANSVIVKSVVFTQTILSQRPLKVNVGPP